MKYLAYIPSPPQGVWHLGWLPIRAYAFFIIVGIVVALLIGDRRWTARGGEPGVIYDIALWAVPFGLVGGRLYHVMTDWRTYFGEGGAGPIAALKIWDGGLGIWGAVALGGVGAWIACRRRGIPLPAFADAIAPGIILAQAIGRLGNYFNQELYGRDTTLPWGLEIYVRRDASGAYDSLNGVSTGELERIVHPTFLYELLWNVLVFVFLIWVDRRFKIGHGRLFALYVAGYCVGRFWVELMRSDAATHIAGIRINSFTSTFVFIGAVVYFILAPKGREDPESLGRWRTEEKPGEESPATEPVKQLAAVAATSGVVAAASVADEHHEAKAGEPARTEDDSASEPADDDEPPAKAEPSAEAEEASADAGPVEGLGAVEGEEVAEAEAAAPEVHEAAVEASAKAAEVAREVADEAESPPGETAADAGEASADDEHVDGLGAVEGEEVAEAEAAAPEVHEAAVQASAEAAEVAREVADEDEDQPGEPAEAKPTEDTEDDAESVGEESDETADGGANGEAPADEAADHESAGETKQDSESVAGSAGAVTPTQSVEARDPSRPWWRRISRRV